MLNNNQAYRRAMARETRTAGNDREIMEKLTLKRDIAVTNVYDRTVKSDAVVVANSGGAGSSKSVSVAQLCIQALMGGNGQKILVTRKTLPALKMSAMLLVVDLLKEYGYYEFCGHNKTDHKITYQETKDGKIIKENFIIFSSLDDVRKMKSTDFTIIWCEEATENNLNDFDLLRMRLRGKSKDKRFKRQMHLTFNPIDQNHWIASHVIPTAECELIRSNHKDNPFMDKQYVAYLENLKKVNYNLYRVYCLGEWGVLENVIYSDWSEITTEMFDAIKANDEWYGLDFGVVHATVLEHIKIYEGKIYIREEIYEKKVSVGDKVFTNQNLIVRLEELIDKCDRHRDIYADSAEPNRIAEISRRGFNIKPANKDVLAGIDLVLRYHLHICGLNTIKEIKGYSRKKDVNGNVLPHPIKFMDDTMDATRYGMYSHLKQFDNMKGRTSVADKIKRTHQSIADQRAVGDQYEL